MIKKLFLMLALVVSVLIISFIVRVVWSTSFNPNKYDGTVEEKISQYMEDRGKEFQGTVLVTQGDYILFEQSYGWADKKKKIKNDENTQYQIGSMTTAFTSAAILKLEEVGSLKTSDKLSVYLPDFPRANDITLHQLLTHTSGIYNYTSDKIDQTKKVTPEEIIDMFKDKKPEFEPGTDFSFSNSNYILLGVIIEKVSGLSYERYLEENILQPLKLAQTTADREKAKNLAIGYKGIEEDSFIDNSIPYAAGMVISTARDLSTFLKALQNDFLNEDSKKKLFTADKDNYAYGWLTTDLLEEDMHMVNGAINGFRSIMSHYPEQDYTVIVLSNNVFYNVDTMSMELSAILFNKKVNILNRF